MAARAGPESRAGTSGRPYRAGTGRGLGTALHAPESPCTRRLRRTPKASTCYPIPWSKSVSRRTCGSWPKPANCSQSFCPRRDRTGASSEPPHAFSQSFRAVVLVPFLACGRTARAHLPGFGLAFLDARTAAKDFIYRSTSSDGCTWAAPVKTSLPNNNSSIQAVLLRDGKIAMAFNNVGSVTMKGKPKAGPRRPLSVALSSDEGVTWNAIRDLEAGRVGTPIPDPLPKVPGREEYSYPAILQQYDGSILVAFTYRRETLKVMSFPEDWIAREAATHRAK